MKSENTAIASTNGDQGGALRTAEALLLESRYMLIATVYGVAAAGTDTTSVFQRDLSPFGR